MDICQCCFIVVAPGDRTAITSGGRRYHANCAARAGIKIDPRPVRKEGEDMKFPHYFGKPPGLTKRQAEAMILRLAAE